jgi:uncharacterized membrane protein YhaH (DUF805 family)
MQNERTLTPVEAISSVFRNYATFSGRARRSEFWWFALFQLVIYIVLYAVTLVIALNTETVPGETPAIIGIFAFLFFGIGLGLALPNIALLVRRLHDTDNPGWFYFLTVIPFFGSIVALVFALLPSNPAGARFDAVASSGAAEPSYRNPSPLG